jgi:hypothetical protein
MERSVVRRRGAGIPPAWPAVVLGICFAMFVAGSSLGIYLTEVRIASVVIAAAAIIIWLAVGSRRPAWRPRSSLQLPLAAALVALGISALASVQPRLALDYLAYAVLLAGLYLLRVRLWADPALGSRLGGLSLALCAGIGLLYVVAVVRRWIDAWVALGHLTVPPLRPGSVGLWFGSPNALPAVLVLLASAGGVS